MLNEEVPMKGVWIVSLIALCSLGAGAQEAGGVDRLAEQAASLWPGWEGLDRGEDAIDIEAVRLVRSWSAGDVAAAAIAGRFASWAEHHLGGAAAFQDAPDEVPAAAWASKLVREHAAWEAKSLAAALRADGADQAAEAIRGFVRARYRRVAAMEASHAAARRRGEVISGLAAYTAYRAVRDERPEVAEALKGGLLGALDRAADGELEVYGPTVSGFALALALDPVCPGWRERVTRGGATLEHLLVVCLHPPGRDIPSGTTPP
jgi:hypothetical protein